MPAEPIDFDALIGAWRRAFEAARRALDAARHEFPPTELGARARLLTDERVAIARLLESFAQERQMTRFLVRLVASPWEAKRLLGVPADAVACVFNVDGVLVPSATIHAEAWKSTFDELDARRIEGPGVPLASFSVDVDYPTLIHGRSAIASVHEYLASRGITLPEGDRNDEPGIATVYGLVNRKQHALVELLARRGAHPYPGARLYLELLRDAGMRRGARARGARRRSRRHGPERAARAPAGRVRRACARGPAAPAREAHAAERCLPAPGSRTTTAVSFGRRAA